MSGFDADWLSAREPVDLRARNVAVREAFVAFLARRHGAGPVTLLDLGAGTGATLRALKSHLPMPCRWRLAEYDPALIAAARAHPGDADSQVEIIETDLAGGLSDDLLAGVDAVTTSAFLDLVSATWVDALAERLAAHGLPFLAMLSYDGRMTLTPADPLDAPVRAAMNAHQRGDKGFGPALGPSAADHTRETFARHGFGVEDGASDWIARPEETAFQEMLVGGWVEAARDMGVDVQALETWHTLRRAQIAAGELVTRVGHRDLAALPE